jgi:hypothetical protein
MNLDEIDPDSPEYEAALEALQAKEDEANGNLDPADPEKEGAEEGTPEPKDATTTTDVPTAEVKLGAAEAETPAVAETTSVTPEQPKVVGVASKDGTKVLPYAALQAERREARKARGTADRLASELEDARRQIEDLKAGKKPEADTEALSDEDLARIVEDFPQLAKVVKVAQAAQRELADLKGKSTPKEPDKAATEEVTDDPIQDAIDQVPLLVEWQHGDPEKFGRAVEIDKALENSPKWKGKPLEERFSYVAKQVAAEFDIEIDEPSPTPTPGKPAKTDPKEVIDKAQRAAPNTLSDFKGGAVDQPTERIEKMSPHRLLGKFSQMSDEEIDAQLAKLG